jgi:hypothetical protein
VAVPDLREGGLAVKWFTHFGANFCRCNIGVGFIFDPTEHEYAFTLFVGPLLFMCGWEEAA